MLTTHNNSKQSGRAMSQPIAIPQVNIVGNMGTNTRASLNLPPGSSQNAADGSSTDNDPDNFQVINQPLTVHVPLKVGPTKNIY